MSNIAKILEKKDKEILLKFLLTEDKTTFQPEGIADAEVYKSGFKSRNGYSLEEIEKSLTDSGITEVNEQDVDKVFSLMKISKAEDLSPATEGLCIALQIILEKLHSWSSYQLNDFTNNFKDADTVRLINLFLLYTKLVSDDLKFITFENGEISTTPMMQAVSKCYDDYYYEGSYVSTWHVQKITEIDKHLKAGISLLVAFLKIYPEGEEFASFKTSLETCLSAMNLFLSNFKDIVILANSQGLINVSPRDGSTNPDSIDFSKIGKSKVIKKKAYSVQIVKNADSEDIEGLVTGIVYEPDVPDSDGNYASAEVIAKGQREFMLNYLQFDVMHDNKILKSTGEDKQVALIQSFIAPQDLTYGDRVVKSGAWVVELQYFDTEIKKKIANGEYTGFSFEGLAVIEPEPAQAAA